MSYVVIEDFRLGMDRRKKRVSGVAGALWDGINGHITRGGDFERRKKFVSKYSLPAGTFGLTQINQRLYVFGSGVTPTGIPPSITYQRLQHTGTANMDEIIDVSRFNSKIYAVASFDNGDVFHYYDGSRVTDWDTVAGGIMSLSTVAARLAAKISLDSRYIASAIGTTITIEAAIADTPFTITASAVNGAGTDDQSITLTLVQSAAPGAAQIHTAVVAGTVDADDQFTITIDGINYVTTTLGSAMGLTALTYESKLYSVTTSLLEFSKVNDPTLFSSGTGSGFINMTNQNEDNEALVGVQIYQNRMAIFSRDNVQVWLIAVDPTNNAFQQNLQNTGALSSRSILQYGNIDVFYLSDSGIRSIKARDASNAPAVNDVGVAIDSFVQDYIADLDGSQIQRACALIEPLTGRYWLALHNIIIVYSYFPGSKITAWTYYDLTDEIANNDITEMVKVGSRVYIRSGDTVYLYGGDTGAEYPAKGECIATVGLPFLSAEKPATVKGVKSFDAAMENTWNVKLLPNPKDDSIELNVGTFNGTTFSPFANNPIQQPLALFAVKMTCAEAGYASVSKVVVHFDVEGET